MALINRESLLEKIQFRIEPQGIVGETVRDMVEKTREIIMDEPTVDAVEVPCHCCNCYYLLNGKNSFGLYFFCGHENGLKNLKNTEKDFCLYAKRRCD